MNIENFSVQEIWPYLWILMGFAIVAFAVLKKDKLAHLKIDGEKAEGIIFEISSEPKVGWTSVEFNSNIKDAVTVRFVTKNKEWITSLIKQDFAVFYAGQYKVGQKLDVYYDPKNPTDFIVDTGQSQKISKLVFIIVGLLICMVGLYKI
jgi:hypothetical protein